MKIAFFMFEYPFIEDSLAVMMNVTNVLSRFDKNKIDFLTPKSKGVVIEIKSPS